jgi:hypothetical protein
LPGRNHQFNNNLSEIATVIKSLATEAAPPSGSQR